MADELCAHLVAITAVKPPRQRVCETCVKTGDVWVHLRTCQEVRLSPCAATARRISTRASTQPPAGIR
jgi:hypothetical protein